MLSSPDQNERFTELWTEVQPAVSHYIRSMVRDSAAAKDVLQATALVLLRKFGEFDQNREFLPWALTVAKFEVLGHKRDHARNVVSFDSLLFDQLTEVWAEMVPEKSDEASALQICMGKLPAKSRKLVQLRYFEELNSSQIAERIGRKAGNIRVTLQRIREQLWKCVEQQLETEGGTS